MCFFLLRRRKLVFMLHSPIIHCALAQDIICVCECVIIEIVYRRVKKDDGPKKFEKRMNDAKRAIVNRQSS
jgi:hypothetical protein